MSESPQAATVSVPPSRGSAALLLASVFVVASCGLIYELLAGTLSTYLLGSSVTQFSLVIGLFLSAMGLGSFLSRFVRHRLIVAFLSIEIAIGVVGGSATLLLFVAFATVGSYIPLLVLVSVAVGTLVGLEIPLLVRIMRHQFSLRTLVGNVLAIDYIGALAASLLFPLVLVPRLGLVRTGFLFGLLNVGVAFIGLRLFRSQLGRRGGRLLTTVALLSAVLLTSGLISAGKTTDWLEDLIYDDEIIYAKSTRYQRLVLTRWRGDLRLYINGNIQFSSVDEFRYHEALVHPAMGLHTAPRRILLLGGGDGMAAREVLKYNSVRAIDLVDLDPEMTRLFSKLAPLRQLNRDALEDKRLTIFNEDAQRFLEKRAKQYDVIIADLPDPNDHGLGKLYSRSFYRLLAKHLAPDGLFVTQATSPYYATEAFWCVVNTIEGTTLTRGGPKLFALPYHAQVPSFGDWGFVLASRQARRPEQMRLRVATRFLTPQVMEAMFAFPRDVGRRQTPHNRLDNQVLTRLYEEGYQRYNP